LGSLGRKLAASSRLRLAGGRRSSHLARPPAARANKEPAPLPAKRDNSARGFQFVFAPLGRPS